MKTLLLLIISILPVFLIGMYIISKDKNRESKKILFRLFLCGIGAVFLTTGLTLLIGIFDRDLLNGELSTNLLVLFFQVFFCIALVEEFSKWFFVYIIAYNNKEYDETFDMIVYAVFVSLGFACLENIMYVFSTSTGGLTTAFARAILAVPGHACDGILMGSYLTLSKLADVSGNKKQKRHNIFMSVLVPTLAHGIYDYCIFSDSIIFFIIFIVYIVLLYIYVIKKLLKFSRENFKFKFKNNYCGKCGTKVFSNYCPKCGNKNE